MNAPITVYTGGRIFTGRATAPLADTIAVQGERVLAVGSAASVCALTGSDTATVPLHGAFVMPGFFDAHTHLLMFGQAVEKVQLRDCTTLAEIQHRLHQAHQKNPTAPRILGIGWRFDALDAPEPTAAMLDAVLPHVPVFLEANDLHSTWVNTAALTELGIDAATPDPIGGEIRRDTAGHATGFLLESASIVHAWAHLEAVATDADRDRHLRNACDAYLAAGVTAATEMALTAEGLATIERMLRRDGRLPLTITAHALIQPTGDPASERAQIAEVVRWRDRCAAAHGTDSFEIVGVKFIVDGVIDACTATMRAPYANGSNPDPIWSPEALTAAVTTADSAGLQLALHAIGDATSSIALDAIAAAVRHNGPRPTRTPRIEHLESATPDTVARMAALGVTASMQPVHCDPAVMANWQAMLGDERAETGFAWHWFRDAGVRIALGTDTPTAPHEALHNLYIACTTASVLDPTTTPYHPDRRFTPAAALEAMTSAGANATGRGADLGQLRAGARADFIVLDTDLLRAAPERWLTARVTQRILGGTATVIPADPPDAAAQP